MSVKDPHDSNVARGDQDTIVRSSRLSYEVLFVRFETLSEAAIGLKGVAIF